MIPALIVLGIVVFAVLAMRQAPLWAWGVAALGLGARDENSLARGRRVARVAGVDRNSTTFVHHGTVHSCAAGSIAETLGPNR